MMNYRPILKGMNIELTTVCPLRCPQCYCSLEGGKHISLKTAQNYLREAAELGLKHVELSGGETLCYPDLYELIQEASTLKIDSHIAISGWGFNENVLDRLIQAGISRIFVSLNAHTEKMNSLTRDGFHYAIRALEILNRKRFSEVYINWVMHIHNADYLDKMIEIAEKYSVKSIVIMSPKPTSEHELVTFPTGEQMQKVASMIKNLSNGLIRVESCFSPLIALTSKTAFLGNVDTGLFGGCGAGRFMANLSVDGMLSPCRHLEYYESFESLRDYWENSMVLRRIRELNIHKNQPCKDCEFNCNCRHCLAISTKLYGQLDAGFKQCPLNRK